MGSKNINHPLLSLSVQGCAQTLTICAVSIQDAFCCFSVKDENLFPECSLLKFHREGVSELSLTGWKYVIWDADSQKHKTVHLLHLSSTEFVCLLISKINQLLGYIGSE